MELDRIEEVDEAEALRVASELESGTVVCIVCNRGARYLSSGLFG